MRFKGNFDLQRLSMKFRLGLLFSALMGAMILFSSLVLFQQHQGAVSENLITVQKNTELGKAVQLREALINIQDYASRREISFSKLERFRNLLEDFSAQSSLDTRNFLDRIGSHFEEYVSAADNLRGAGEVQSRYDKVANDLGTLVEKKQGEIIQAADSLRQQQKRSTETGILLLTIFMLILMIGAMKMISHVTEPLSVLAHFLDQVNVEDDLAYSFPNFRWNLPEITRVVRSFEQLVDRLRGYRALNVRRLLLEKRRADIIAASIADGIFLLRDDEILYVNPVGERILGLPSGKSWKGLKLAGVEVPVNGDMPESVVASLQAIQTTISRTIPVEFTVESDQRKYFYLLQAFPISDEVIEKVEHSFYGGVEQLLDRWQANLLVLAQDVTLVRESQEAKSHFLGTLSHEIKTPVTSLTMATRLLRKAVDQFPNPTHRALIDTCAQDVDRLRGLLEDLLSVSSFDTLTQKFELKDVDIAKLLKQSVQHFQLQAFERGIDIEMKIMSDGKPVLVSMDATKISWAFSNLFTNALRHTPRGGKVEATLAVGDETVEISIRDSGPGIDKNRQDRIFNKFNPFYDLRVARSGNTGMGLAIAREIVIAHAGRIWVTSEPGEGAEFCFTLPLRQKNESKLRTQKVQSEESESMIEESIANHQAGANEMRKGVARGASARS